MEQARDPFDLVIGLREDFAEVRATISHMQGGIAELKLDVRRLDDRLLKLMLLQLGTLATALAALITAVAT